MGIPVARRATGSGLRTGDVLARAPLRPTQSSLNECSQKFLHFHALPGGARFQLPKHRVRQIQGRSHAALLCKRIFTSRCVLSKAACSAFFTATSISAAVWQRYLLNGYEKSPVSMLQIVAPILHTSDARQHRLRRPVTRSQRGCLLRDLPRCGRHSGVSARAIRHRKGPKEDFAGKAATIPWSATGTRKVRQPPPFSIDRNYSQPPRMGLRKASRKWR